MKLNLGNGNQKSEGWKTISLKNADYCINFEENKEFPFDNNTIDCIHTSHLIEHLTDKTVLYLFKECYRVLKMNGVFHIVTPDLDLFIDAYLKNDFNKLKSFKRSRNRPSALGTNLSELFLNHFMSFNIKNKRKKLRKDFIHVDHVMFKRKVNQEFFNLQSQKDIENFIQWIKEFLPSKNNIHNTLHINAFNYKRIANFLKKSNFTREIKNIKKRTSLCKDINKNNWDTHSEKSVIVEVIK